MDTISVMSLIISALIAIWGIYQTYVTKGLEEKIHRLSVELDQSIQLLYRIREAVTKSHNVLLYMLTCYNFKSIFNDVMAEKYAEWSALIAEARGIALTIGDNELIDLLTDPYKFEGKKMEDRILYLDELALRARSEKIHARVSKLIQLTTKVK